MKECFAGRLLAAQASCNSEEEFLAEGARLAMEELQADACDLLLKADNQNLDLRASTVAPDLVGRMRIGQKVGIAGHVIQEGQMIVVENPGQRPAMAVNYPGYNEAEFGASVFLPMALAGQVRGVAILRRRDAWKPSAAEKKRLTNGISLLTKAIFGYRSAISIGAEENPLGALREVTTTIARSPYLEEILQLLVNLTAQQFGYRVCTVRLLDRATNELVLRATQATMPEYQRKRSIRVGESIAGRAVQQRQTIVVRDVRTEVDYIGHDLATEQGLRSMVCVPLTIYDQSMGVLTCYTDEVRDFSEAELLALETIAKQAAFSIERANLQVRSTLMQEMHHRVKNNLQQIVSLLRLQLRHKHYESIEAAITDSIARILSIAAVHDLLSREDLDRVSVLVIAESLVQLMQQGVIPPDKAIRFDVRGQAIRLGMTQATQIALVLNELVLNAIEHGFETAEKGEIHITFETEGEQVKLWVANNGDPLPPDFDVAVNAHLGLQIVSNLARGLGGSFKMYDSLGWAVAELQFVNTGSD